MITRQQFEKALNIYEAELNSISTNKSAVYFVFELFAADVKDLYNNNHFIDQLQKLERLVLHKHRDPDSLLANNELFSLFTLLVRFKDYADGKKLAFAFEKQVGDAFTKLFNHLKVYTNPFTQVYFDRLLAMQQPKNQEKSDSIATDEEQREFSSSTEEEIDESKPGLK